MTTVQNKVWRWLLSLLLTLIVFMVGFRKPAPVVAAHLLIQLNHNKQPELKYECNSSYPFITDYGKMVLAEFKYDNVRDSDPFISKFVDTIKEQYSMWLLKKYGLPWKYWNLMLKGIM